MTTEHDQLVARLREDYCCCHDGFKSRGRIDPQCESCNTKDERNEAADAIEALEARVCELTEANEILSDALYSSSEKRQALAAELSQIRAQEPVGIVDEGDEGLSLIHI